MNTEKNVQGFGWRMLANEMFIFNEIGLIGVK